MKRLIENYLPVINTLENINNTKNEYSIDLENMIKYFRKIDNLLFIGYYSDILEPLYILTKSF